MSDWKAFSDDLIEQLPLIMSGLENTLDVGVLVWRVAPNLSRRGTHSPSARGLALAKGMGF